MGIDLAGVLHVLIRDHAAMTAATSGQVGGFMRNVVAPRLWDDARVLYLGEHDLAGNQIEANTRRVLERYHPNLQWERLALTAQQVLDYNLPVIIKHDRRYTGDGAHEAVGTEALSQRLIVQIVDDRLEELLPQPLADVLVREKEEGNPLRLLLSRRR